MKPIMHLVVAALCGLVSTASPVRAEAVKNAPLDKRVKKSVEGGIKYIRGQQQKDGSWEIYQISTLNPGGCTALALLALLNAGVPANDPAVAKGLAYLRKVDSKWTYVRALQTMVFAKAGQKQDLKAIQDNVKWLIASRIMDNDRLLGWNYGKIGKSSPDNSNSSYAILALHTGHLAGVKVPKEVWKSISRLYRDTQEKGGGWGYSKKIGYPSDLTMAVAGLTGLLTAELTLRQGRQAVLQEKAVKQALDLIGKRFNIRLANKTYYTLHAIAELGRIAKLKTLGNHDWYREGAEFLVKKQNQKEGSWPKGDQFDQWPLINTSFAVLFLSGKPK
jgi:hypothetical protein